MLVSRLLGLEWLFWYLVLSWFSIFCVPLFLWPSLELWNMMFHKFPESTSGFLPSMSSGIPCATFSRYEELQAATGIAENEIEIVNTREESRWILGYRSSPQAKVKERGDIPCRWSSVGLPGVTYSGCRWMRQRGEVSKSCNIPLMNHSICLLNFNFYYVFAN